MKLVVLYGPPGVGKLTVAQALAKKTGYKVFHNHLTIEPLAALFEWGSKPFNKLIRKFRFEVLEEAARNKIKGVVFTFVYAAEADDRQLRSLVNRMKRVKTKTFFVQLLCQQQELERRVVRHDRSRYNKIRHVKNLRSLMRKYDVLKPAPFPNTLSVDTTKTSARQTAKMIQQHFKL